MVWRHEPASTPRTFAFPGGQAVIGLVDMQDAEVLARDHGVRIIDEQPGLRSITVSGAPSSLRALDAAPTFDTRLRYVEPVAQRAYLHQRNDPLSYGIDAASGRPYEWTFRATHADRALNISRGSPDILVGVVDSGFAPVPDLKGKYKYGWYYKDEATTAFEDAIGHGTYVSSIIASNVDDGIGLAGYCGSCRLQVFKLNKLTTLALRRHPTTRRDGVRIINLSLGGGYSSIEPMPSRMQSRKAYSSSRRQGTAVQGLCPILPHFCNRMEVSPAMALPWEQVTRTGTAPDIRVTAADSRF